MEGDNLHSDNISRPGWSFSLADIFAVYGWYLLILTVVGVYFYKKAEPAIDKYFAKKREQDYAATYHKNPDLVASRLATQQSYVQQLQDKYSADALDYQKKQEEKESKKRELWLSKQNGTDGHRLGKATTSSVKPEYNPLMGDTSGPSYRPQRKSPCSGGGCGR